MALVSGSAWSRALAVPPVPQRWITDEAHFLSPSALERIDTKLESYERATGRQVVVWIGDSLGDRPLDEFAVKTFEAWKIGKKGRDDGVLLIVLARDRKMAIEVGYGLEPQIPDAVASRIIHDLMAPRLRAGDPDGAVDAGVAAILESIDGKPFASDPAKRPDPEWKPTKVQLIGAGVLAVAFLILFLTNPSLAIQLLFVMASGRGRDGRRGGFGGGGGGFAGGGGRSGGGGARGSW
ncbi:MAG: TPM domain-containing protein [Polyangiaceae bacterium]